MNRLKNNKTAYTPNLVLYGLVFMILQSFNIHYEPNSTVNFEQTKVLIYNYLKQNVPQKYHSVLLDAYMFTIVSDDNIAQWNHESIQEKIQNLIDVFSS